MNLHRHPIYTPLIVAACFAILIAQASVGFLEWPIFEVGSRPIDAAIWFTRYCFTEPFGVVGGVAALCVLGFFSVILCYHRSRS